ncbi:pyridoxamine 5'-phosphate oxidase family protein [Streptomyces sp. NPDC057137]|uniref:pyridoxamine 5'-phosphate oxidase family protein n=1 Tax=Streptomyces sp. NPDC057137 TaxID=3346030 RepID=UPI00363D513E
MFPPEAAALLSTKTPATFTTLLPDGSPHSVVSGVVLEGDQLVTNTAPTAKRLKNLKADPRVNVLIIDPASPMRYVEVRGTATVHELPQEQKARLLQGHAQEGGTAAPTDQEQAAVTVLQIRVTPSKVTYHSFDPRQLGPAARQRPDGRPGGRPDAGAPAGDEVPRTAPDGVVREDEAGRWIEFERTVSHAPEAVWAALTEPARLVLWQHPVEFFPELREGATVYAHLNPQAKAFALGKVTLVEPAHALAFRWTTTHPALSPDVTLSYVLTDGALKVSYGPFGKDDAVLPMMASLHIHLDHLDLAITTPDSELPAAPWPEVSVVTKSGRMQPTIGEYAKAHPELGGGPGGPGGPGRPGRP